ncbi:phosphate ABC transporter substrate-binding protein PstS family protein [Weissella tructae]|jgi:phosphate transport system substrate-binding protein|uniref:Phosphate-binding protein n=2 Tax=Weissella TaxID=46255 RepID=A0A075U713_9LACO|nr:MULTISPECIES: phosphate ABC transporter substrate-binding protein PstS family protein [Weissella]AIG65887.1 Phosphate ABC superfamily ATP binding cassette transporter substrate-binding protein [Weissella tructae]AIM63266.1 Phosphate ABC superfamily ATP binding cassette transporter substrate-binding protein [Weissella ceti]AIM64600.1 Phosphate ABC superfamily ATP binding cassette transporter substrate-binding protein [Weissella ceti]ELA07258.1 phosphate ABC transporter substrate-binding prote
MKRSWFIIIAILATIGGLLTWGYVTRDENGGENITAVGSTALQPLVEAAGEDFANEHLGTFVNVQGGGTGTGLAQVQSGAVDLGNSDVFAEEKEGIDASALVDHKVAVVGIAPMLNKENKIDNLTQQQLIDIFTGKIKNWKEIGGADLPVVVVNRVSGSGTRLTFEKWGLKEHESMDAQEQDSSGMTRQIVATTPGAISYAAFAYLDNSISVPTLDGVKPEEATVKTSEWPIWSYEHVYTKGQPRAGVQKFIEHLNSEKIQGTLVPQLGYISIHEMEVERDVNGNVHAVKGE